MCDKLGQIASRLDSFRGASQQRESKIGMFRKFGAVGHLLATIRDDAAVRSRVCSRPPIWPAFTIAISFPRSNDAIVRTLARARGAYACKRTVIGASLYVRAHLDIPHLSGNARNGTSPNAVETAIIPRCKAKTNRRRESEITVPVTSATKVLSLVPV